MSEPRLCFRPMKFGDLPEVISLENAVYPFPWSERIFRDCIRVGYDCWLALEQNQIIGHAVISVAAGESHMLNLSIAKPHQRKGYGKLFINFLLDIARRKRAEIMMLEVRPSNKSAINCYNASGFNEIGCRKDYYPALEGKEDALLFARQIS